MKNRVKYQGHSQVKGLLSPVIYMKGQIWSECIIWSCFSQVSMCFCQIGTQRRSTGMLNINHFEMKHLHEESGMFECCILKYRLCFPQKVSSGRFEPKLALQYCACSYCMSIIFIIISYWDSSEGILVWCTFWLPFFNSFIVENSEALLQRRRWVSLVYSSAAKWVDCPIQRHQQLWLFPWDHFVVFCLSLMFYFYWV